MSATYWYLWLLITAFNVVILAASFLSLYRAQQLLTRVKSIVDKARDQ